MKRSRKITFRVNEDEFLRLKRNVKKSGYSQEAYIRTLLSGYTPKESPTLDYLALMKELRAIGNRMNQIAVKANAIGFIKANEYEKNVDALWLKLLEIQAAFTLPERMGGKM